MDATQFLASLGGTAVIVAAVAYILRHSFERMLDSKLKAVEERAKLSAAEDARRRALLFDKRLDVFRAVSTLLYRAKVAAQESLVKSEGERDQELRRLESYHEAIVEMLFQERALLPERVFLILHESKHVLQGVLSNLSNRRMRLSRNDSERENIIAEAAHCVQKLEECYTALMKEVEASFGDESA